MIGLVFSLLGWLVTQPWVPLMGGVAMPRVEEVRLGTTRLEDSGKGVVNKLIIRTTITLLRQSPHTWNTSPSTEPLPTEEEFLFKRLTL